MAPNAPPRPMDRPASTSDPAPFHDVPDGPDHVPDPRWRRRMAVLLAAAAALAVLFTLLGPS